MNATTKKRLFVLYAVTVFIVAYMFIMMISEDAVQKYCTRLCLSVNMS